MPENSPATPSQTPHAQIAQVASSAFFLFGVPFKTNFDKEVPHELGATPDRVFATIPHEGK